MVQPDEIPIGDHADIDWRGQVVAIDRPSSDLYVLTATIDNEMQKFARISRIDAQEFEPWTLDYFPLGEIVTIGGLTWEEALQTALAKLGTKLH